MTSIGAGMDMLRWLRILVRIGDRLLVGQPVGVRLFYRSRLLYRWDTGTRARKRNFRWQRHDGGILSIWRELVADLLRRFVLIRRRGVGLLSRRTLSVRWRFRNIDHHDSPGNNYKPLKCHGCSEEKLT